MPGVPGVGGQNAALGGGRTSPAGNDIPNVRPVGTKTYYWQEIHQDTTVESIRQALLEHLAGFHVEAPDDLIRHLASSYYSLLHAQKVYESWDTSEEMPTYGRRPVANEIDFLYVTINKTWKEVQALSVLDDIAASKEKEEDSPLTGMMRQPRKVVPLKNK